MIKTEVRPPDLEIGEYILNYKIQTFKTWSQKNFITFTFSQNILGSLYIIEAAKQFMCGKSTNIISCWLIILITTWKNAHLILISNCVLDNNAFLS